MSKLSKEKIEQIRNDAVRHRETKGFYMTNNVSREEGYIEGATVEAERAEVWKAKAEAYEKALLEVHENLILGNTVEANKKVIQALSEYQSYTSATKS